MAKLDQNLTLAQAYEKQSLMQKELEKIKEAIKVIYHEADIEAQKLFTRQDDIDDELKILDIEILAKSTTFNDHTIQRRL